MVIKIKENYFCFYKKKRYKYKDELGSRKSQSFLGNGARKLVGIS
jgi:hypothetical protein